MIAVPLVILVIFLFLRSASATFIPALAVRSRCSAPAR